MDSPLTLFVVLLSVVGVALGDVCSTEELERCAFPLVQAGNSLLADLTQGRVGGNYTERHAGLCQRMRMKKACTFYILRVCDVDDEHSDEIGSMYALFRFLCNEEGLTKMIEGESCWQMARFDIELEECWSELEETTRMLSEFVEEGDLESSDDQYFRCSSLRSVGDCMAGRLERRQCQGASVEFGRGLVDAMMQPAIERAGC